MTEVIPSTTMVVTEKAAENKPTEIVPKSDTLVSISLSGKPFKSILTPTSHSLSKVEKPNISPVSNQKGEKV